MTKRAARTALRTLPRAVAIAIATLMAGSPAAYAQDASEADSDSGSGISVSWNNTIRYGMAFRVKGASQELLHNPNNDDGDRNFGKGLISNRVDLLSELDLRSVHGFGARISAQGWYDSVYHSSTDNPGFAGGAVPNNSSTDYRHFNRTTRRLHGQDLQLRDAFVFMRQDLGGMATTLRVGQHAQVWGESLFFAANGISGAQNRFDVARLLSDPTAQAKEFVLPVPQISGQIQITPDLTIGAYYQFRWRPNTFPSAGSYFSVGDIFGPGAENMWISQTAAVPRTPDMEARNSGQGGVQLKWRAADTDFGVYLMRFHDKTPQIITKLGFNPQAGAVMPTAFYEAYHENTKLLGASASHTFGQANVAIEASLRRDQALASSGNAVDTSALGGPASNNTSNPPYASGNTAHINLNTIWSLAPNALFRESTLVAEAAWSRMLSCTKHCSALDTNGKRDGLGLRMVFSPTFRQLASGLDLSVPVGISFATKGSRPLASGPGVLPANGGGDMSIGLSAVYNAEWFIDAAFTHFHGAGNSLLTPGASPVYTYAQNLKDRDFVSLTVRRSF